MRPRENSSPQRQRGTEEDPKFSVPCAALVAEADSFSPHSPARPKEKSHAPQSIDPGAPGLEGKKQSLDGACVGWNAEKAKSFISNKSRILFLRRHRDTEAEEDHKFSVPSTPSVFSELKEDEAPSITLSTTSCGFSLCLCASVVNLLCG